MTRAQKIILVLVVVFGLIQFIRPERNIETNPSRNDIFYKTDTPIAISTGVQQACYDCHSNNTVYPWYASVAPVSWMLANHVKEGKKHLNFSEWTIYSPEKRQKHLLEIVDVIENNDMPPKPYQMLHKEAMMAADVQALVVQWARDQKAGIQE
jgi:cbb3-type cytochrome oxidase cytochrome c subunit